MQPGDVDLPFVVERGRYPAAVAPRSYVDAFIGRAVATALHGAPASCTRGGVWATTVCPRCLKATTMYPCCDGRHTSPGAPCGQFRRDPFGDPGDRSCDRPPRVG